MVGWLQNHLLSAGWRHEWRMPGVSLRALWPSSSSFAIAHPAFQGTQHTNWNWLAHAGRLATLMHCADLNTDACCAASACQVNQLGIDRYTCTSLSHHVCACPCVCVPVPCQHPDWTDSYEGRWGFNWGLPDTHLKIYLVATWIDLHHRHLNLGMRFVLVVTLGVVMMYSENWWFSFRWFTESKAVQVT